MHTHPQCVACRCLMHKNAQCRYDAQLCRDCDAALARRGARRCRECGSIKPLRRFQYRPGHFYRDCIACRNARRADYMRAYRDADREPHRARSRAWYAAHREQHRAYLRRVYWADPERARERARRRVEQDRERRHLYDRAYRAAHRERLNAQKRHAYQRRKLSIWFGPAAGEL